MDSQIAAAILVPADEDPLGLLKEGSCGARPPTAYQPCHESYTPGVPNTWGPEWGASDEDGPREDPPYAALVLAWDGEVVLEGVWVAVATLPTRHAHYMRPFYSMQTINEIVALCVSEGLGTLILLDANGKEIPHD